MKDVGCWWDDTFYQGKSPQNTSKGKHTGSPLADNVIHHQ